ncbi:MAG TPA: PEP/pyruvate-binding domain-containing protein [Pyrinomonadaceae bacterium]|nr:PEP/pyruvate-binding domain-containing protein [Pyrinomonadaceae bacterium]
MTRTENRFLRAAFVICLFVACALAAPAQTRRPAPRRPATVKAETREAATPEAVRSLPRLASRAEFDSLSRVYNDTPYALPHVIFVIDRKDNNRIYYVNSKRYRFHKDFVNGTYLSLERGREFFENNYLKPNRRFILGTLAYQTPVKRWTFEFWEGDLIPTEQIKLVADVIGRSFFEPVAYKPNSNRQEEASASIEGLPRVLQSDIAREQEYEPLNVARGIGRIHVIEKLDETVEIGSNEILVLSEVPIHLPPVAGIIVAKPSTPLSHINLLAKGWGVPNAYIKNAQELLKQYDGWWVTFETHRDKYTIKRADRADIDAYQRNLAARDDLMTPRADLAVRRLASLREQRTRDTVAYGAKSANLGHVMNARLPGIVVPEGFTVPLYYYDQFVRENGFEDVIYEMMQDQKFVHNPPYRRERLKELRARMQAGKVNEQLKEAVLRRVRAEFAGKGLFVRSSSNTEDLPNFNGAGLYDTVPNVKDERQLIEAVKTVWASLWNFEAYEARERAGINHTKVYMAVLIQEGINADSAGVMITTDPYDAENRGAVYISAKRGLGIKVVEGKRIPEQVIFRPRANSVQVLTRSEEESLLTFDERGGVKEIPVDGSRAVLSDDVVRRLSRAAAAIKRLFGGREQDIEWVFKGGRIYIVQSRPFVSGS